MEGFGVFKQTVKRLDKLYLDFFQVFFFSNFWFLENFEPNFWKFLSFWQFFSKLVQVLSTYTFGFYVKKLHVFKHCSQVS